MTITSSYNFVNRISLRLFNVKSKKDKKVLDRDEQYLCPHGNEAVEGVDLDRHREGEVGEAAVAVDGGDVPADVDQDAFNFVLEMRRRRCVTKS
jgi:hypothetical protein